MRVIAERRFLPEMPDVGAVAVSVAWVFVDRCKFAFAALHVGSSQFHHPCFPWAGMGVLNMTGF